MLLGLLLTLVYLLLLLLWPMFWLVMQLLLHFFLVVAVGVVVNHAERADHRKVSVAANGEKLNGASSSENIPKIQALIR